MHIKLIKTTHVDLNKYAFVLNNFNSGKTPQTVLNNKNYILEQRKHVVVTLMKSPVVLITTP